MKHKLLLAFLSLLFLVSCASEWRNDNSSSASFNPKLKIQHKSTTPKNGLTSINIANLKAGDILFSADSGINSISIRLINHSSISHAFIYLGDGLITESISTGVRIGKLEDSINNSNLMVVYRHPDIVHTDSEKLKAFATSLEGNKYNYLGILKQTPYSIVRNVCELPVVPRMFRYLCLNSTALITITPFSSEKYFCSQYVIEAFNHIGKPLTSVIPEWVNPSDLLHMREDDIHTITTHAKLKYIGHIKCQSSIWNSSCEEEVTKSMNSNQQSEAD